MARAAVPVRGQRIPESFAATLRTLRESSDPRLDMVLASATDNGWTLTALGNALGVSYEAVRQRVVRCRWFVAELPTIPLPPRWPDAPKKARPRLLVKPELADELRAAHAIARSVNGTTPVDAESRRVTEWLSAQLAALSDQGVSLYTLAQVLGVTRTSIHSRLARHGYRSQYPSVVGTPSELYRRRHTWDSRAVAS